MKSQTIMETIDTFNCIGKGLRGGGVSLLRKMGEILLISDILCSLVDSMSIYLTLYWETQVGENVHYRRAFLKSVRL